MARSVYMTLGKKKLIDFMIANKDRHFTVDEIAEELPDIGKSSIYRMVAKLHENGELRRFETEGISSFVYQYVERSDDCDHHFHLKCENCGKIIHMECGELERVKQHIESSHGFVIGTKNSIIYGLCAACSNFGMKHTGGCKCVRCRRQREER